MTVASLAPAARAADQWWRDAVIYQVYIRSFADGDGDGIGDIAGIRSRLPYLVDLGVDALWVTPWYPSPMADGGYDVADYRDIEPMFGDLDQADALITEAHEHGLRIILDIVPNHSSDAHAWFVAAAQGGRAAPERGLYWFRPAKPDGAPPNNWNSVFGGSAWQQLPGDVEAAGAGAHADYYLHLFAPEQPDLNWDNPKVRADFEQTLRFWFDRGVDGFRIDVAHGLAKDPKLPDVADVDLNLLDAVEGDATNQHPFWDQPSVHEIYRDWRTIADGYADSPQGKRVFVAEAWVQHDAERLSHYARPDELHTTFNFSFLMSEWDARSFHDVIDEQVSTMARVGAPVTWVVSNHDVIRHRTRYGRAAGNARKPAGTVPTDLELGLTRARAMTLFMLALPGSAYIYQGEELGLFEVEDLPEQVIADPTWFRTGAKVRGRDGCRVPLPWSGSSAPYGFGPTGSIPWLPQPAAFAELTVQAQAADETSVLSLYRKALKLRKSLPGLGDGPMSWVDWSGAGAQALAFGRGEDFICVVNVEDAAVRLPEHREVLVASTYLAGDTLPGNSAAWLAR